MKLKFYIVLHTFTIQYNIYNIYCTIPVRVKGVSFLISVQNGFEAYPSSYPVGTVGSFYAGKVAEVWG
jgi:hypothetical protein